MKKIVLLIKLSVILLMTSFSVYAIPPLVDSDWLEDNLAKTIVIDLRSKELFEAGHIPNSKNATYGEFGWREKVNGIVGQLPPLQNINKKIALLDIEPKDHVIVVPGSFDSTSIGAGVRVYWTFKVLGHDKISLLDGGYNLWEGQIVKGSYTPNGGGVYPGVIQENLIYRTSKNANHLSNYLFVDSRPDQQFFGFSKHPEAKFGGSIPNAQRLPEKDLFVEPQLTFKSKEELEQLVKARNLDLSNNKPIVSYCNTGHWAATSWFVLSEILGNKNTILYDGSWVDWSSKDLPVAHKQSKLSLFWNNLKSAF